MSSHSGGYYEHERRMRDEERAVGYRAGRADAAAAVRLLFQDVPAKLGEISPMLLEILINAAAIAAKDGEASPRPREPAPIAGDNACLEAVPSSLETPDDHPNARSGDLASVGEQDLSGNAESPIREGKPHG